MTSIWYFSVTSSQLLHFIICNPLLSSVPAATVILTLLHLWLYCEFLSPMGKWTFFFRKQFCCTCFGKKRRATKIQPKKKKDLIAREVKHKLKDCKVRIEKKPIQIWQIILSMAKVTFHSEHELLKTWCRLKCLEWHVFLTTSYDLIISVTTH